MIDRMNMTNHGGRADCPPKPVSAKARSREPSGPWTIQALFRYAGNCRGFSLVEITLAMMVISVAILAIFSMFPAALNQGTRASGDTYASLFAEQVFNRFHAQAETDWASIGDTFDEFDVASGYWENPGDLVVKITGTNGLETLVFENLQIGANPVTVNDALRYRLALTTNGDVKSVVLMVWNGEYGSLNDPNVFYTELYAK